MPETVTITLPIDLAQDLADIHLWTYKGRVPGSDAPPFNHVAFLAHVAVTVAQAKAETEANQ